MFFSIQLTKDKNKKIILNHRNITSFKEQLPPHHWRHIDFNGTVNEIHDTFLRTMTEIYDANSSIREYILKEKDIESPWISKGLRKSSKKNKNYTSSFLRLRHLKRNLSTKPTKVYSKN